MATHTSTLAWEIPWTGEPGGLQFMVSQIVGHDLVTQPPPICSKGFPGGSVVKNPPANPGDARNEVSIPGLGRSPGVGNGNPPQYSCLENSMDRAAWQATVHGVTKNWTQLSD